MLGKQTLKAGVLRPNAHFSRKSSALVLGLTSLVGAALTYQTLAAKDEQAPQVVLPKDPQHVVLSWNTWRTDLPPQKADPRLQVLADGTIAVTDPSGAGVPAKAQLSQAELQDLLRFTIYEQGFFGIDQHTLPECLRAARSKEGAVAGSPVAGSPVANVLCVSVNDRQHEIEFCDPAQLPEGSPQARQLGAIEQRLQRLSTWVFAGGQAGLDAALQTANRELLQSFPSAPPLNAQDLRSALKRPDGSAFILLERYAVAPDQNPFSFVHARVERTPGGEVQVTVRANLAAEDASTETLRAKERGPWKLVPPPVAEDPTVKWDYPIVYVRAPRPAEDPIPLAFPSVKRPAVMPPGSELMILYPDGHEDVLVPVAAEEAVTDPVVSFDGEWVYYVKLYGVVKNREGHGRSAGSQICKVHVPTRTIVPLTHGRFTPNTGADTAAQNPYLARRNVFDLAPCPVPGGKIVFTSDRNAFTPAPDSGVELAHQLFVMDEEGNNVECIGHLNLGSVLHPVVLKDGRVMFATNETQGLRGLYSNWGLWTIHPDGTNWGPLLSAFTGQITHFQTQLSDGKIVVEDYYDGVDRGFGTYYEFQPQPPAGQPAFGPGWQGDPRNRPWGRLRFGPFGFQQLTLFASNQDVRPNSGLGQVTQPAGAPDNHLLTVWGGSHIAAEDPQAVAVNIPNQFRPKTDFDSGIYLIKSGRPINEPAQMLAIKNDPRYHELWPRALVPYQRIYGIQLPTNLSPVRNDGGICKHLAEGSPFGAVGSSSLYTRESYPNGKVPPGKVTATFADLPGEDPFLGLGSPYRNSVNWLTQGSDAGRYENSEIHAIRILLLEPVTRNREGGNVSNVLANGRRSFYALGTNSAASARVGMPTERYRILGEIPVRKFNNGQQPLDPDGNPDTSFEAVIPANVAWTFQTLDKHGMVLNMAQTWHQVRPGERRVNCGGCHAHSQKGTDFELTAAARPDYVPWDLTGKKNPLLAPKTRDQSGRQWDNKDETGVRFVQGATNVEYFRDVKPILDRSCIACHTHSWDKPAGDLVLDDNQVIEDFPGTYYRLALDNAQMHSASPPRFAPKPLTGHLGQLLGSRYVHKLQARRSLLIWKVFGQRLDGFQNDDFAYETVAGDPTTFQFRGQPLEPTSKNLQRADIPYRGSVMPPAEAVAGTYQGPDGQSIQVPPLSAEDRFTLVRWVDLGCPIDLAYDSAQPQEPGKGLRLDDQRPTLTVTYPRPGANGPLSRILVGMHDYGTGLDLENFQVVADFAIEGVAPGENLAKRFRALPSDRWELSLSQPITNLPRGNLTVSIKDQQGNVTSIERTFSVGPPAVER